MAKLRMSELVEVMLARAFELGETQGYEPYQTDFMEIGHEVGADFDSAWQATEVLEDRGLIQCARAIGGNCSGHLTGTGRMFVENGGDTGIIGRYQQNRGAFVYVSNSPGANVNTGHVGGSQISHVITSDTASLVSQIREMLKSDAHLAESERRDALAEVQVIEVQLSKSKPSGVALRESLDVLGRISSIGSFILKLGEKLGKYR